MTFEFRELDPARPETMNTLFDVFHTAHTADAPRHPEVTEPWLRFISGQRVARERRAVAAFDGGTPVGFGILNRDRESNQDMVYCDLWIVPERRAEATVPLLAAFRDFARARGCKRLVTTISEFAENDYRPALIAGGARQMAVEQRSQLDLTGIDREQYSAWAAPSEKNAHYRIEYWTVPTPEHLLEAMVLANEAMRDAPKGELEFELPPPDVDRRRQAEQLLIAAGERKHIVAALTGDGEVAGFHETYVVPGFRMADIGSTGVAAKFRGHGLGLRLKADLALRLLDCEPHVEVISTWNDSGNVPMLRVNDTLGYTPADTWSNWQFDL